MGHHIFIHNDKSLLMGDWAVALVRHFLIEGASRVGDQSAAKAIKDWEYHGPGVWVGIDESALVGRDPVFIAAVEIVEKFGDHISLDYLQAKVQLADGGQWLTAQSTAEVAARIRCLDKHLHGRT